MKQSTAILLVGFLAYAYSYGQQSYSLEASLNPEPREISASDNVIWTEDVDARTPNSSTYYSNDGQIKIVNRSVPLNYYNELGELIPIDPVIRQTSNGEWKAEQQPYPTALLKDGSMQLTIDQRKTITFGKHPKVNSIPLPASFRVDKNEVDFEAGSSGIWKHLTFRENGVKYSYVVPQPAFQGNSLVFSEEVILPHGYSLETDESYGRSTSDGWSGNLQVKNVKGEVVSTFHAPLCFDAQKDYIVASYAIRKEGGKYFIDLIVPGDWLSATNRSYPVVVDPQVTGPTAAWLGGMMPSCMTPSYNQDSIQVTIPGQVTVTELNITASFYADPFTSAVMADGTMFFSTDCANSQNFSITGTAGQTAGTAYLDYFNIYNPLTCCYPKSCNFTQFWLSYHLGRSNWGSGCNTTYIRYDPGTTSWPFEAVVIGKTPETYGGQWVVPSSPVCSNECTIDGIAYAYYGVPPYTFTHPWSTDTVVLGTNSGCTTGATSYHFSLTIPNCPVYCDENYTSLDVPPPTITDVCGNTVVGLPTKSKPIKVTPQAVATYDPEICSGSYAVDVEPCVTGANLTWNGNGISGDSSFIDTYNNTTDTNQIVTYQASAELDGCYSDTLDISILVHPLPTPEFSSSPDPVVSSVPAIFTDATNFHSANGVYWGWDMGDGNIYFDTEHEHTYGSPGEYNLCLHVIDDAGCEDSLCKIITVVPAEVERPNVVTANNDGVNDLLIFNYLDFYPDNVLYIYNRWGSLVYETTDYQNDWNGIGYNEGTYYYLLKVNDTGDTYQGFFQLVK